MVGAAEKRDPREGGPDWPARQEMMTRETEVPKRNGGPA
jgi:hypothetical protein